MKVSTVNNGLGRIVFLVAALLLLAGPPPTSQAATRSIERVDIRTQSGQKVGLYTGSYALLIGVSDYTAGWPDLESVPREMDHLEKALRANGFQVTKVLNPTAVGLEKAFEDFIYKYGIQPDNRLLIFFSGHGHTRQDGAKGYLVPADAPPPHKNLGGFLKKSVSMSQVLTWAREVESKHALFLFDSCFSGTVFKAKDMPIPKHITAKTAKPVRQFITAGSAGERVPAKSVFTPLFIDAISGEADRNRDGYITGNELGDFLLEKVTKYNPGQTPQYGTIIDYNLSRGDFVFTVNNPSNVTTTTSPAQPPATIQASPKRHISDLLAKAEAHMKAGRLTTPKGSSAVDFYRAVLRKEPANTRALDGLHRIVGKYVQLARDRIRERDWDMATTYLNRAATVSEADIRILTVRDELRQARAKLTTTTTAYVARPTTTTTMAYVTRPPTTTTLSRPAGRDKSFTNSIGMKFRLISAGSFLMGRKNGGSFEKPVHRVEISQPFFMGMTEVTQRQWKAVMGYNPSGFRGNNLPVEKVSWNDAQRFIGRLNAKERTNKYRLPTEAEWEYACREGGSGRWSFGNAESWLDSFAWYKSNSNKMTHPVGQKRPNGWGLHDMHGNVWEWCLDWYGEHYYGQSPVKNPTGPPYGRLRVCRGGSWYCLAWRTCSAYRNFIHPGKRYDNLGFRIVAVVINDF